MTGQADVIAGKEQLSERDRNRSQPHDAAAATRPIGIGRTLLNISR